MNTRSREILIAWGFLSPALVILIAFGLFPICYAFYVSLHKWQIKQGALIGLDHYRHTLGDPQNLLFFIAGLALVWAAYRLRTTLRGRGQPRLQSHIAWVAVAQVLVSGGELVVNDPPEEMNPLDWIVETSATYVMGVPTHAMDILADQAERGLQRLGSVNLFYMAGAPCLLYTSPSPRDGLLSRLPSSA